MDLAHPTAMKTSENRIGKSMYAYMSERNVPAFTHSQTCSYSHFWHCISAYSTLSNYRTCVSASDIEYPDMVAKDREFREAQRKHKREEEEAARRKKAAAAAAVATAAAAAAVSRSPHIATHSEEPPKKGFRSPETGEQKCASLSNDLNSVSTDKHTPVPSDSCSASVDLEERLRVLRVCKPKPANPAIPKSSEVVDPILLQPPQVSFRFFRDQILVSVC